MNDKTRLLFVWLTIFSTVALHAESKPSDPKNKQFKFTFEQVLGAPFPSLLQASPAKGRFVWVFNAEGKRNIWIAEPFEPNGKYTARQITRYTEDDGQEISELSWTPNAESVVYVRGGGA